MIHYIKQTYEELNICKNSSNYNRKNSDKIDYLNKKFIKPWGYEYLCFQNEKIGIWILHINKNDQTSLHCHFKKDTILLPLCGSFRIDLYDSFKILNECEMIYCPYNTFHGIKSYSDKGIILEIEVYSKDITYSDKNDLLRLKDNYNRDKNNYESSVKEIELDVNDSINFHNNSEFIFGDSTIKLISINKNDEIPNFNNSLINIIIDGTIVANNVYSEGAIIDANDKIINILSDTALILSISNNYYVENSKIIYSKIHLQDLFTFKTFNTIGLTSGCFDIIHIGHIDNLKICKSYCDTFFLCLSSDKQIKELKGKNRPINTIFCRTKLLTIMPFVDYIILYDEIDNNNEKELDDIMNIINPNYWFKGSDYNVKDIIKKHPCLKNIIIHNNIPKNSTTNIIKNIQNLEKE